MLQTLQPASLEGGSGSVCMCVILVGRCVSATYLPLKTLRFL